MSIDLFELYHKYRGELHDLSRRLRMQYHVMQAGGYSATFGDVEGEILYALLREIRPQQAFEISPAAGWSTNYVLAALTANGTGRLHSFELSPTMNGRPTEASIRRNQHPDWDQQRFMLHIGDARMTTRQVGGAIDFLLLDSCHEAAFARWYIDELFPRVNGPVLIQDIAFEDHLEPSTEAKAVWTWAKQQRVSLQLIGRMEPALRRLGLRRGFAERRGLRCNSILLHLPFTKQADETSDVTFSGGPDSLIEQASQAEFQNGSDQLLDQAVADLIWSPDRTHRHRAFIKAGTGYLRMGNRGEAARCFQRALGTVLTADPQARSKGTIELLREYWARRQWRLFTIAFSSAILERRTRQQLVRQLASKVTNPRRFSQSR